MFALKIAAILAMTALAAWAAHEAITGESYAPRQCLDVNWDKGLRLEKVKSPCQVSDFGL
jgi:hypothetical protein